MQSSQEILIQHIEEYRARHGLSYMELANQLQIPYTTLTGMLHQKRIPRIDTVDLLARAMGVETYELLLPMTKTADGVRRDAAQEDEVLAAVRRLPDKKKRLLMAYLELLEELG